MTQIIDSVGGTITRVWDGLDRLTSETTAQGTVGYSYDAASRRTKLTVPGQADVTYGYDNANRPTTVSQGAGTVTFGYDNANRRTSLTLANGVTAAYAYDAGSQLTAITYTQGATTVGTLTYAYDNAGRISARGGTLFQSIFPAAVTSATYDADNRLTAWAAASGTLNPTYDANGRQITDGGKGHGSHTLTWDARGRLTAIAATPASFAYDAIGRRTTATIAGTATGYLYDGADIVQELAGATPNAGVLTGGGIDERFSRTTGGATSTFLTDFLGSTVALADSTGAIKTNYAYDPYGVTSQTGAANTSPYQYTGRENDGATGLYYYRARYYNPAWGRFISEDPIGLRGGVNLYQYAAADSLGVTDPSGMDNKPRNPICPQGGLAGPLTNLIGEKFADAAYAAGKIAGTNPQIQPAPNGIRVTNSPINIGNRAVTLGNFEIFTTLQTPTGGQISYTHVFVNNGRHEDGHTYQATALGDLYLPVEAIFSGLFGDKNPLETDADRHALSNCP